MIVRRAFTKLLDRLEQFPAVALIGPRQVGKTTLAKAVAAFKARPRAINTLPVNAAPIDAGPTLSVYLDLESPADRRKLSDPLEYLQSHEDKLVILDEIHREPELFPVLRGLIDEGISRGRAAGRFLILGSASFELLRQTSETLAGRYAELYLGPFNITEIQSGSNDQLWLRGGFPKSYLAKDDEVSAVWRDSFIRTFLERDVPQFSPRLAAETLRRLWTMLAYQQGGIFNAADFARSLAVDGKTVVRYLDILVDLLMVRRLEPLYANVGKRLVKSPKIYVRDSGMVHALLELDDREKLLANPVAGGSWEGFAIENILAAAPDRAKPAFFKSAAGAEIDLVLDLSGNERWAIEIKRGSVPGAEKGFHIARKDVGAAKSFVVYSGAERFSLGDGVEAISLNDICGLLSDFRR
jgi:predicted AAA+ superfamily ATPase